MNSKWLIRVYRDLYAGSDEVEVGTAYPIAARLVLVARHVVAAHPNRDSSSWLDIDARKITLTWVNWPIDSGKPFAIVPPSEDANACQITVKWDGRECGLDAAILECELPPRLTIEKSILLGKEPNVGEMWSSCGFAQAGLRDEKREPQSLQGKTEKYISGKTYHVGVDYPVKNPKDWRGLSGAPVFVNGAIEGLITDNAPPYDGRIEAIPIYLLLKNQAFCDALGPYPSKPAVIDPTRFRAKIVELLKGATSALRRLEEAAGLSDFQGTAISFPCGSDASDRRAMHIVDNMFADLGVGGRLLELALSESVASGDAVATNAIEKIAFLFFPACFTRDKSEQFLNEYRQGGKSLIDAKATSVAWIEFRMAAIDGRAANFDPDQTRAGGPVGRMKIHNPPPFALEAMREEEYREAFAKLLYEKRFSRVGRHITRYSDYCDTINAHIEVGKKPEGAPYIVLGAPGDETTVHLTDDQKAAIARELRDPFSNLMVTQVSNDLQLAKLELDHLDWLWQKLEEK